MIYSPMVSIIITSFNREKYIAQAIESALNSTFTDFELIIVDDCSSDKTVEIAKKYEIYDSRVKIYINNHNLGQFNNRNYATSLAKGKYIKYLDSDDYIYPTGLQVLVDMMEKFPDAGYGLCTFIQDDMRIYPFQLSPEESFLYHYHYRSIFHRAPVSSIIKRSAFEAVGGFEIEAVCGDFAFWLNIGSRFPVVLMPDGIIWYREHTEGEMEKARTSSLIAFEYHLIEAYYLKKISFLDKKVKNNLLKNNQKKKIIFLSQLLKKLDIKSACNILKNFNVDPELYFVSSNKMTMNSLKPQNKLLYN